MTEMRLEFRQLVSCWKNWKAWMKKVDELSKW